VWEFPVAYAFPPLLPRVIRKIAASVGVFLLVSPFWPAQMWYPVLLGLRVEEVCRLPEVPGVVDLVSGAPPLLLLPLLAWKSFGSGTVSPSLTTPSVVCDGWIASSLARYDAVWRAFRASLDARGVPLVSVDIALIAVYLSSLFASGRAYRTIALHRAVLSYMFPPFDGHVEECIPSFPASSAACFSAVPLRGASSPRGTCLQRLRSFLRLRLRWTFAMLSESAPFFLRLRPLVGPLSCRRFAVTPLS